MKKPMIIGLACLLTVGLTACGRGGEEPEPAAPRTEETEPAAPTAIAMRVFEGSREAPSPPARTVTSSFLQYDLTATVASDQDPEAQGRRIGDAFNLASVTLLAESLLVWEQGKPEPGFQVFRIENKSYQVRVMRKDPVRQTFKIDVDEQNDGTKINLLSTEAGLPRDVSAVFGFKDIQGKPYFLSLQVGEWSPTADGGSRTAPVVEALPVSEEEPVKATGDIKPPRQVKRVEPVYPEEARKARVEGVVILEATTDVSGRVASVKVLRSVPGLDQAAVDAIKQWVYEPVVLNGRPRGIVFTVTVRFALDKTGAAGGEKSAGKGVPGAGGETAPADLSDKSFAEGSALPPVPIEDGQPVPTLVRRVEPVYPEDARKARIEGTVILEATVGVDGRVSAVKVLRSVPGLDRAAVEAVEQWAYKPLLLDGKPRRCLMTVTVRFELK